MIAFNLRISKPSNTGMVFAIVLLMLKGCTASNYGRLKSNPDITQAFESYQVLPDHRYYYRGTSSRPAVIAGININYDLNSRLWVEVDPQSGDFRKIIDRISPQGSGGIPRPWGFDILDKSGRVVCVWYSAFRAATVEIDDNGRIVNLSPMGFVTRGDQSR